jgi:hypothetical protein
MANPPSSDRLEAPTALTTASSRSRSRTDRYMIEPMIPAATSHSRALMRSIDWRPRTSGRSRSVMACSLENRSSPGAPPPGTPLVSTAMVSGCPPKATAWASSRARNSVGVPKNQVTRSASPTTSSRRPLSSSRSPTARPSSVSATTSPALATARPPASGGMPSPPGRALITFTSRTAGRRTVECTMTSGSALATPGMAATRPASAAGIGVEVVNGPGAPAATSHASAPRAATIRRPSPWRLAANPAMSRVMANTSEVASTAITKRRRRHWRSRSATRHIPPPAERPEHLVPFDERAQPPARGRAGRSAVVPPPPATGGQRTFPAAARPSGWRQGRREDFGGTSDGRGVGAGTGPTRARRQALVGLALLVGVASGAVMAAAIGARRTDTAYARLLRTTRADDAEVELGGPGYEPLIDRLRRLPQVADLGVESQALLAPAMPSDPREFVWGTGFLSLTSVDGHVGQTINRPLIVAGRRPDPGRVDEIGISELVARRWRLRPGGTLRVRAVAFDQLGTLFSGEQLVPAGPALALTRWSRSSGSPRTRPSASAPRAAWASSPSRRRSTAPTRTRWPTSPKSASA